MVNLKVYEVNGLTYQLSEEDANRLGDAAKPVGRKQAASPQNKERKPGNKDGAPQDKDE